MSGTTIVGVDARQVFSDRGYIGVEAKITTQSGVQQRAFCTGGMSMGSHEVVFNYDGGTKWGGKGVQCAVDAIKEKIAPLIMGMDAADQQAVDAKMLEVGKAVLGGNAVGAVSAAVLKAGAAALGIPLYRHIGGARAVTLPVPGVGFMNGKARYGGGAETDKPTYTFVAYDFGSYEEASYALWEINRGWRQLAEEKFGVVYIDGYGGYGWVDIPTGTIKSDKEIWNIATENIARCGYEGKVGLFVDIAASEYYDPKTHSYQGIFDSISRDRDQQIDFLCDMVRNYPFVSLEDPLHEDDFEGTAILTRKLNIQIVGDDLFTSNPERVRRGIEAGAATTVLLKVNQIGSITESFEMVQLAYDAGYSVIPCASRGEGATTIADYCVGLNATTVRECGLKEESNRFIEIERELGSRARFLGKLALANSRFNK